MSESAESTNNPEPKKPTGFSRSFSDAAPALYAWFGVRVGGPLRARCDAEDLLQEVCFRAYTRFGTYDSEKGPFRHWVFGIANNVLREALSEVRRRPEGHLDALSASRNAWNDVPDEATSVSRRIAHDETLRAFVGELRMLDNDERDLLIYRGLEGLSHAEVGEILGIESKTAQKRWERLLARLREKGLPDGLIIP